MTFWLSTFFFFIRVWSADARCSSYVHAVRAYYPGCSTTTHCCSCVACISARLLLDICSTAARYLLDIFTPECSVCRQTHVVFTGIRSSCVHVVFTGICSSCVHAMHAYLFEVVCGLPTHVCECVWSADACVRVNVCSRVVRAMLVV